MLENSYKGFRRDMTDFTSSTVDGLTDHEKRISILEKKIK